MRRAKGILAITALLALLFALLYPVLFFPRRPIKGHEPRICTPIAASLIKLQPWSADHLTIDELVKEVEKGPRKGESKYWAAFESKGEAAIPALVKMLGADGHLDFDAMQTLAEMKYPKVTEAMIARMNCANSLDRESWILFAIERHGDPRAWPYLIPYTKGRNKNERITAIQCVAGLRDPSAIPSLKQLRRDRDTEIRQEVNAAISELKIAQEEKAPVPREFTGKLDVAKIRSFESTIRQRLR